MELFLGIHSEEVPTRKCGGDQFLNNECRNMRKKKSKEGEIGEEEN